MASPRQALLRSPSPTTRSQRMRSPLIASADFEDEQHSVVFVTEPSQQHRFDYSEHSTHASVSYQPLSDSPPQTEASALPLPNGADSNGKHSSRRGEPETRKERTPSERMLDEVM